MNRFDQIYDSYVSELRRALAASAAWWSEREAAEASRGGDRKDLEARWPFGPQTHPWVLAVYIKHFKEVTELSEELGAAIDAEMAQGGEATWGEDSSDGDAGTGRFDPMAPIAPWELLIDALHGVHDDLADALEWMVYQPVGLDRNDRPI